MSDWADDISDSILGENSRDYAYYPLRDCIIEALRKAKADGMREAVTILSGRPYSNFEDAEILRAKASEIERLSEQPSEQNGAVRNERN